MTRCIGPGGPRRRCFVRLSARRYGAKAALGVDAERGADLQRHDAASGRASVGYRFVRGGRSLRRPFIERVDMMDLSMFTVMVHVTGAFSKGGIPLTVQGVANVKLPGEEPLLSNAVERFLGRSREEIYHIAKETLEGNLRGVLASLTPEEVNEDKMRFAHTLLEEAEHDMSRMGLVLDTLKIQNVTDEVNYLASIGRIRGATLNMEQATAEASARADASVQQAKNWAKSEIAKTRSRSADRARGDPKAHRRRQKPTRSLDPRRRGAGRAQIRPARRRRSSARRRARSRRSGGSTPTWCSRHSPSSARRKSRRAARPRQTIERGRAEAESLKKLVDAFRVGGAGRARGARAAEPAAPARSGRRRVPPLSIKKLSVLPPDGAGSELARKAIGASEQIRAATGVDLGGVAKKFGG